MTIWGKWGTDKKKFWLWRFVIYCLLLFMRIGTSRKTANKNHEIRICAAVKKLSSINSGCFWGSASHSVSDVQSCATEGCESAGFHSHQLTLMISSSPFLFYDQWKSADKASRWNQTLHDILRGTPWPFLLLQGRGLMSAKHKPHMKMWLEHTTIQENVEPYLKSICDTKADFLFHSIHSQRLPLIKSLILRVDWGAAAAPNTHPSFLPSPCCPSLRVTRSHFPGTEHERPFGNSSSSIELAIQYPLFKGIHCRLIGITWLEMLTLVFWNKVSINL